MPRMPSMPAMPWRLARGCTRGRGSILSELRIFPRIQIADSQPLSAALASCGLSEHGRVVRHRTPWALCESQLTVLPYRPRTTNHVVLDAYIYNVRYSWSAKTKARRVPAAEEQLVPHSHLPGR